MPYVLCKCGEKIECGGIPNENEWLFISDENFDVVVGCIDAEDLYEKMHQALCCSNCRRLVIYVNGFGRDPIFYKLDDD